MVKFLGRWWVLGINSSGFSRKEPDLNIREREVDHVRPFARRGQERVSYEKPVHSEHRFQQCRKEFMDNTDSPYGRNSK
jgi:hypothetical protein